MKSGKDAVDESKWFDRIKPKSVKSQHKNNIIKDRELYTTKFM